MMIEVNEFEQRFLTKIVNYVDNLYHELADEHYEPTVVEYYELITDYFKELTDNEMNKNVKYISAYELLEGIRIFHCEKKLYKALMNITKRLNIEVKYLQYYDQKHPLKTMYLKIGDEQ